MTNQPARLLGAHMPTAGGLDGSLLKGRDIGCTAVQVFTANPRQWNAPALDPEMVERWKANQRETGIGFTAAHDSYLINLAAPDREVLERSRQAMRWELERAEALGIPWVVTHMGAYMDSSEDAGIELLCESMSMILRETDGMQAGIALETTAGQGTCLGYTFEQIARVVEGCAQHPRAGVCLDTCHAFVAGYDIRSPEGYDDTIRRFDSVIGLDRLKLIHANDAKRPLGSRVDRHEHIGQGEIGLEPFRWLVTDPRLLEIPVVIETPESETMHAVNLAKLLRLAAGEEPDIRVTVHVFGHYRDFCADGLPLEIPRGSTVNEAAALALMREPRLQGMERICRAAVNEEYSDFAHVLSDGDTVAFIPPMSGG